MVNVVKSEPSKLSKRLLNTLKIKGYKSVAEFERKANIPHDRIRRLIGGLTKHIYPTDLLKCIIELEIDIRDLVNINDEEEE